MAKKSSATSKNSAKKVSTAPRKPGKAVTASSAGRRSGSDEGGISEAFIKFLQSPLVADLLAVAATAALAALAEHGFSNRGAGAGGGKRAGRAVKEAGKAAAAAIGRRIGNEFQEIRAASKSVKDAAAK